MRVTLSMSDELLEKLDKESDVMGMNRSATVAMILSQYFQSKQMMGVMGDVGELLKVYQAEQKRREKGLPSLLDEGQ